MSAPLITANRPTSEIAAGEIPRDSTIAAIGASVCISRSVGSARLAVTATRTYRLVDRMSAATIARGNVRSGSTTSSATLTMSSKPINA
jgi:hypothetical protein